MIYLGDLPNATIFPSALTVGNVTQTTTGPSCDMITGDGVCSFLFAVGTASITALTAKVQQSTLSNSGFADITGASCYLTAAGNTGVVFNRDYRYLQAVVNISGTTGTGVQGVFIEAKKVF